MPGAWLEPPPARRAWEGGSFSSSRAAAAKAFAVRTIGSSPEGVALAPITEAQRIAALTPAASDVLDAPEWLTVFAGAASAGGDFWA